MYGSRMKWPGGIPPAQPSDRQPRQRPVLYPQAWFGHVYEGAHETHLTTEDGTAWFDFLVDESKALTFTKDVGPDGVASSWEDYEYRTNGDLHIVYEHFPWTPGEYGRRFSDGLFLAARMRRRQFIQVEAHFVSEPSQQQYTFLSNNRVRGPFQLLPLRDDVRARVYPVEAILLESISGVTRERYWYGRHIDGPEVFGLIRWDWDELGADRQWIWRGGGTQLTRIVRGQARLPS